MNAALLNRHILAELLPRKLDECRAVVTRRLVQWEAHCTSRLHASTKGTYPWEQTAANTEQNQMGENLENLEK